MNNLQATTEIKNVAKMNENLILSDELRNSFSRWRLVLFKSFRKYLAMSILMVDGICGIYQYEIEILHQKERSKYIEIEKEEFFTIMKPGNTHKLIKFSKLLKEKYLDKERDFLRIKISIRILFNEKLNHYSIATKSRIHKIKLPKFMEENKECFHDEQGFWWQIKANNLGEGFLRISLYLINGLFDEK